MDKKLYDELVEKTRSYLEAKKINPDKTSELLEKMDGHRCLIEEGVVRFMLQNLTDEMEKL